VADVKAADNKSVYDGMTADEMKNRMAL
jgi:hypothetical protein